MSWDPALYLRFADQRLRPALDLLARIDLGHPQRIVDLGCGAGNVTLYLKRRWPGAQLTGVDNSPEMLAKARETDASIQWENAELASWAPQSPPTLIYSNAALHWVDDHAALFPRLARAIAPGGVLAVQMPRQHGAPSHRIAIELAKSARWRSALEPIVRESPVAEMQQYYDWLAPHVGALDIWETEYLQIMRGGNPVADWTSGTFLLPFFDALQDAERESFATQYRAAILEAYPYRADGTTLFPFRRMFIVGTV